MVDMLFLLCAVKSVMREVVDGRQERNEDLACCKLKARDGPIVFYVKSFFAHKAPLELATGRVRVM
jgi:hypothetical protein